MPPDLPKELLSMIMSPPRQNQNSTPMQGRQKHREIKIYLKVWRNMWYNYVKFAS